MKKPIVGYVVAFVVGFAVCAIILKAFYGFPGGEPSMSFADGTSRGGLEVAAGGKNPVAAAAAKIGKSVVNIDTVGRPVTFGAPDFFGFVTPQEVVPKGQASGVIIRSDGYIITNNHVVADASSIYVTLYDGKKFKADIIGRDPKTDLAVIKISAGGLVAATFASDKQPLLVGDWVIAVGNSLGLGTTVTVGVVSATDRRPLNIEGTTLEHAIQTDAAINRGNSGGALADINGNLIGINTAIASTNPGGGSIGIGFAIPSKTASWVADQIVKKGKVVRPWIGIRYLELNEDVRREFIAQGGQAPPSAGAMIQDVVPGSPADRSGLQPLDVITEINAKKITSVQTIADEVGRVKIGAILDLTVWHARTGKTSRMAVRTGEMPSTL